MSTVINLQTDLLRTFVSVVELGGHTRAGEVLGRSQPAISLQIRRLEQLVGHALLIQKGRTIRPTADGEVLLTFAREVIRLNDEAVSHFRRADMTGVLRIGLPSDYAVAFLQNCLTDFSRNHPEATVEIHCDLSRELLRQLSADELDMAIAMMPPGRMPYLSRSWVEQPIWAAADGFEIDFSRAVPLAAHPDGCDYRARMIQALDGAGLRWRVAYTGPGISGLQNAVQNSIGISALTRPTLLPGMRMLTEADGLPPLESIRVGLFYKHPRLSVAGLQLVNALIARLDAVTEPGRAGVGRSDLGAAFPT